MPVTGAGTERIMERPLGEGLDVRDLLSDVARHYLKRALEQAAGNKTKAAQLIGLPSYQTLSNWIEKLILKTASTKA